MVCFFSFYTLRKSLQTASALPCRIYVSRITLPGRVTDFVSLIYNLKTVF
ncbi:Uncharacterised protein [Streptococcus pneumoniae]|nr:Uncharacterised protein [Streptococcus pneumoniae]